MAKHPQVILAMYVLSWTRLMSVLIPLISLYKKWHKIRNINSKLRKNEDGDPIFLFELLM
jgi:hypothetical protein